jgi:predicted nucleic acid-binding protein
VPSEPRAQSSGFLDSCKFLKFLTPPVVEILAVDRRTAEIFGAMVAALSLRGRPIPTNDIWIAAAAVQSGARLVTWDAHFQEIPLLGAMILES